MDSPQPTLVVPGSPFASRAFGAFWTLEALLGFVFAGAGFVIGGEAWFTAIMLGLGLFLAFVGTLLAVLSFARARIKGPLLIIGPGGLRDSAVVDRLLPWPAISWRYVIYFRGAAIMYEIDEKIAGPIRLTAPVWIMSLINRAFGYERFSLMTMGTGKSLEELSRLLAAYKPESRS